MKCLTNLESFALLKKEDWLPLQRTNARKTVLLRVRIRSVKGCWGQLEYTDAFFRYHPGPECMYNAPLSVLHCAAFPSLHVIPEDAAAALQNQMRHSFSVPKRNGHNGRENRFAKRKEAI
jgi:hypothetical protein